MDMFPPACIPVDPFPTVCFWDSDFFLLFAKCEEASKAANALMVAMTDSKPGITTNHAIEAMRAASERSLVTAIGRACHKVIKGDLVVILHGA
jgi:hypothetical protein